MIMKLVHTIKEHASLQKVEGGQIHTPFYPHLLLPKVCGIQDYFLN